jgi:hypothetical protein
MRFAACLPASAGFEGDESRLRQVRREMVAGFAKVDADLREVRTSVNQLM